MNKSWLFFIIFQILLVSCSEQFDLNIPNNDRVVVEGAITNEEGPYFIKLGHSRSLNQNDKSNSISNARIIISDNKGVFDTLKLLPTTIKRHPKWYYYFITLRKYSGLEDTVRLIGNDTTYLQGIYFTTKIQGTPGTTYSLEIDYNNTKIQATEEMPNVPIIDSVKFREQFLEKDGQNYFVPLVYFKEPQDQVNYYMFNFGSDNLYNLIYGSALIWNFSILDDTYLNSYVMGFNLDDGASPVGHEDFYYFNLGERAKIRMLSLTKNAFNYYKSLLSQFENDGGAYSPTPANPPTNLSGNALGYFRASAVSEVNIIVH